MAINDHFQSCSSNMLMVSVRRSSLLHQVTGEEEKYRSAYAQLLTLSSAPDDMFNIFIIQPKELNTVIRKWKTDTFWQYPSLGGWVRPDVM